MQQGLYLNEFGQHPSQKVNYGIQQLYLIGLTSLLPFREILAVLKNYVPFIVYNKLSKYCLLENPSTAISWSQCKNQLDLHDLRGCSETLMDYLETLTPTEKHCTIFHIHNNDNISVTEPDHSNTETLVLEFLTYVYRRNVLASVVKYIILKDLIFKFSSSLLTPTHKGVFSQILFRLNQVIFESILLSFNGANYDNILLANPLILCLTKLKHKINIFKKDNSITTIKCVISRNILNKQNKKINCNFPSNLYIKDIRFMVSPSMTLERVGQLFNISFKKLVFPYNQATSIGALKNAISLQPHNDVYWNDAFTGKTIKLEDRINAQHLYEQNGFVNLYDYGVYYLQLDCLLLHSIVNTLFITYLNDSDPINIFLRRKYTQSSLSFQDLFIIQPSRQIVENLAPKSFSHPFLNHFIKKSVTGGLCTSFVHGDIGADTVINSHFPYVDLKLNPEVWPNFQYPERLVFDKVPAGILTLDIRSLYPSAACKPIPVNTPLIYTRFTQADARNVLNNPSMLNLKSFCAEVQTSGNFKTDYFKLINRPPIFFNEFNAINNYLSCLPKDIAIVRFQSNFTALGQLYFVQYPVDGFLSYTRNNILNIKLIQYNSVYRHGHIGGCSITNTPDQIILAERTDLVKTSITDLYIHLLSHFNLKHVEFEYVVLSECQFENHQIPKQTEYICHFRKKYNYKTFLQSILDKTLTGFVVVRNLELKSKNPIMGFLIQKAQYGLKKLSPYTATLLKHFNYTERVVSVNKSADFMIISTHYLLWLMKTFGFESTPDIYHGVFFQYKYYLKGPIERKLQIRSDLKEKIKTETNITAKQNLEVRSELIKLMLNSCYGFTLCNLSSSKFKCFKNAQTLPKHKKYSDKIKSSTQLAPNVYLNEFFNPLKEMYNTTLGHVGSNILFFSKIILLKRLYFVLKYLNPCKSMLLYMDTDSAHILLHHSKLHENVDDHLREDFLDSYKKHFEEGHKVSGIWVAEGFFTSAHYIGEKSYVLSNPSTEKTVTHMKGLNRNFQERFVKENINTALFPHINFNIFQKTHDFIIYKSHMSKDLFTNYLPCKRYFVHASGSLPLKLTD